MTQVQDSDKGTDSTDAVTALMVEANRSRSAAAGLDPSQYIQVTAALTGLDQWPEAFLDTAREHLERARQAELDQHLVSAAGAYRDASLWFHFATCVPCVDLPTVRAAETQAADALGTALRLESGHDPERIEAFDSDLPFVALIQRPEGVTNPPIVLIIPGLDSSKEEFQTFAAGLHDRGMATVSIDGPGQGESVGLAPLCPTYEQVVTTVLDRIVGLPNVDLSRVAAVGFSLGGFHVVRAVAYEPRLKAAVAVTGPYALDDWEVLPPPLRTSLALRAAGHDAEVVAASIDLTGVAPEVRRPLLVVCGEEDPVVPPSDMHRLAAEAPHAHLLSVPGGGHLCANRTWKWQPAAADWLADQLHAGPVTGALPTPKGRAL
jgi:dienelactone hydrolase